METAYARGKEAVYFASISAGGGSGKSFYSGPEAPF